jgi:hypothetical protein
VRVWITNPPGIFAQGILKGVVSEQGPPDPRIVIEMNVAGVDGPVEVTLNEVDLTTIVRLARNSTIQRIRDTVA